MSDNKATQAISGRVAEADHEFLMRHPIPGQVTASEKLRHVLSFFRGYHESLERYEDCLAEMNRLAEPARKRLKKAEAEAGVASELVDRLHQLMPEIMAQLITARVEEGGEEALPSLIATEDRLFQSCLLLLESVLRMGLTRKSPTYNPQLLRSKLETVRELVEMIRKD